VKYLVFFVVITVCSTAAYSQQWNCTLKDAVVKIGFGSGDAPDVNIGRLFNYQRLSRYCPPDGYYSYASSTSDCFGGDWHTLNEDHTPGDVDGNMLLVNGAPDPGIFLKTVINGLKPSTNYEIGVWILNLCRPSDKCPYPLLPNIIVRMETTDGGKIAEFTTGDIMRYNSPHWKMYRAMFQTPPTSSSLILVMADSAPGGCGNDFALDDISFRECIKVIPPKAAARTLANTNTTTSKKTIPAIKTNTKKTLDPPMVKATKVNAVTQTSGDTIARPINIIKEKRNIVSTLPLVLTTRENALVRRIETGPGELKIELYDNGEIDGDTVSIYHNNVLIKSHAGLSDKPISFTIPIDATQPHHELIMVADNLGSIPPNTSVMIITTATNRYEVFISSTEQKNAKVIFDLKK
jgi:hypothetical protein